MGSCDKDKFSTSGTLVVEFDNVPTSVSIYPIENQVRPLFEIAMDGKHTKSFDMNIGNYYSVVGEIGMDYPGVTFQIQAQKTTKIKYTTGRVPVVTYK